MSEKKKSPAIHNHIQAQASEPRGALATTAQPIQAS